MTQSPITNHQSPDMYRYPALKFVSNTLWRQWWHLLSEVMELGFALLCGNLQHAAAEAEDVGVSKETMQRILSGRGADIGLARQEVIAGHRERGYYLDAGENSND